MKIKLKMIKWFLIVVGIYHTVGFSFSVLIDSMFLGGEEMKRVTSPNEKYDAVLYRISGGAATSFVYDIYILPKGKKSIVLESTVLHARRAPDLDMFWDKDGELIIQYSKAEICKFDGIVTPGILNHSNYVGIELVKLPEKSN